MSTIRVNLMFIFLFACAVACTTAETKSPAAIVVPVVHPVAAPAEGKVEWITKDIDFGKCKSGNKLDFVYQFKNTGGIPVMIESVKPSCGCVAPGEYTRTTQPGDTGIVTLMFDSSGKVGIQKKSATVSFTNTTPKLHTLQFHGEVIGSGQ